MGWAEEEFESLGLGGTRLNRRVVLIPARKPPSRLPQQLAQIAPGEAGFAGGDGFWRAGGDDCAAACAAFWPHVDEPVGGFNDIEVVFDDDAPHLQHLREPVLPILCCITLLLIQLSERQCQTQISFKIGFAGF